MNTAASSPVLALIIESSSDKAGQIAVSIETALKLPHLLFETVDETDAIIYLETGENNQAVDPALIFIGPGVKNTRTLIHHVQIRYSELPIFFIENGYESPHSSRQSSSILLAGTSASAIKLNDVDLPKRIAKTIKEVLQRRQLRSTLDRANQQITSLRDQDQQHQRLGRISDFYLTNFLTHTRDAVIALDVSSHILYWSNGAERIFGLSEAQAVGAAIQSMPFWNPSLEASCSKILNESEAAIVESTFSALSGQIALETTCSVVRDNVGRLIGSSLVIRDVSERERRQEEERATQQKAARLIEIERQRLRNLFKQAPGFIAVTLGPSHVFDVVNEAFLQIMGHRSIEGKPAVEALPELQNQEFLQLLDQVYATEQTFVGRGIQVRVQRRPDSLLETRYVDFVFQPITEIDGILSGIFCQGTDVTEHRLTAEALASHQQDLEKLVQERTEELSISQQALQRSQKLEAIGKLTGGTAHDFNNILQIISNSIQLLQLSPVNDIATRQQNIDIISSAVERGSKLSSQLLAFARRQPLQPVVINLGRVIRRMDDLLRRALGETIEIETVVAGGLWRTLADPNQLENVILNLALNARDAMPDGGKLTLEVGNALLDDQYVRSEPDLPGGQYVLLAVSDTGTGMSPEVIEHAFEPFYTTKKEGEGTGLGLSMAYGFTKQSGGHIRIYSELGNGTTFKIYLPRCFEQEVKLPNTLTGPIVGGNETILVVEDDPGVRDTAVLLLKGLGYSVLQASDGQSALNVLHSGVQVDMLFTDVVMPGSVRSPDLAKAAVQIFPNIAVLFTSGYTQNAIVHGGRLDPGVELLSKPYSRNDLALKVRQLLKGRSLTPVNQHQKQTDTALPPKRILVVEDDEQSLASVRMLFEALGYEALGASSAEDALDVLAGSDFDVLMTDVNLPGRSGLELIEEVAQLYPHLKVVIASGYGTNFGHITQQHYALPKPYDLAALQEMLRAVISSG